jgi:hypothetical protein
LLHITKDGLSNICISYERLRPQNIVLSAVIHSWFRVTEEDISNSDYVVYNYSVLLNRKLCKSKLPQPDLRRHPRIGLDALREIALRPSNDRLRLGWDWDRARLKYKVHLATK